MVTEITNVIFRVYFRVNMTDKNQIDTGYSISCGKSVISFQFKLLKDIDKIEKPLKVLTFFTDIEEKNNIFYIFFFFLKSCIYIYTV